MLRSFNRNWFNKLLFTKAFNCSSSFRWYSTSPTCNYGVCLDIDGVLIKGNKVVPETRDALKFLNGENKAKKKIPFVLLTNGGGVTEKEKAEELSKMLDFNLSEKQIILSHSPMKSLVSTYQNSQILVLGGAADNCRRVAESYGFNRVVIPDDIIAWDPSIWPFKKLTQEELKLTRNIDFSKEPIKAIMMFHDSRDWGRDLQITLDVLKSKEGYIGTSKDNHKVNLNVVPLYFSNPDIIWSTDFPIPRYAQGSFRMCLELLSESIMGHKPNYKLYGKPEPITYVYAARKLGEFAPELNVVPNRRIYAVGDNPSSDIAGANRAGWTSILVRTGIFSGKVNDHINPAKHVADNVLHAVEWMFSQEERV
ncbi:HAD-like domain-containing protein [Glomus cerebriforme]|uniref:HAD-like domain-containing protein n=1 Tax=Glomus cerebriforme TaxID=658196 RepID=A0A397SCV5_9GLOM|nr:HAD-like domain-containing protein [Glomus cerebriforme]